MNLFYAPSQLSVFHDFTEAMHFILGKISYIEQISVIKLSLLLEDLIVKPQESVFFVGPYHIETWPNQWAGFYTIGTSVMKELETSCDLQDRIWKITIEAVTESVL